MGPFWGTNFDPVSYTASSKQSHSAMGRNNGTVPRATFKDRKKERKIEKKEAVRRNFHDALPKLHLREHYDIFFVWPTRQLRIEKGTGAEMRPAIASGIVTRDARQLQSQKSLRKLTRSSLPLVFIVTNYF